jgi:hypothetical protein
MHSIHAYQCTSIRIDKHQDMHPMPNDENKKEDSNLFGFFTQNLKNRD